METNRRPVGQTLAIALLSLFAFIGLNSLVTDLVLPITTQSLFAFVLYEFVFVSIPAIVVVGASRLLNQGVLVPGIAILLALMTRTGISLSLESGAPAIRQLGLELVGLAVGVLVVRLAFRSQNTSRNTERSAA